MSWTQRLHPASRTPPLSQVQAAAQNLADLIGLPQGKARVAFQAVADVALLGTVAVSGTLATIHLYRALFPRRKQEHPAPEAAVGDGAPPRRRGPPPAPAVADPHDGHEHRGHPSR